ncbi:hypothetical protein [Neorhizobium sp. DT-125]|uniref:hypothetical protein n=1 Tax=Neorhizobium sp. DT-125 TaxID=3396163 RepID=UPI003F1CC01D
MLPRVDPGDVIAFKTVERLYGNKKGRSEIAPTFLIIAYPPVPVHPWSKVRKRWAIASGEFIPALISNANGLSYRSSLCSKHVQHPLSRLDRPFSGRLKHGSSMMKVLLIAPFALAALFSGLPASWANQCRSNSLCAVGSALSWSAGASWISGFPDLDFVSCQGALN